MEIDKVEDPDEIRTLIPVIKSAWGMENTDQLVKDIIAAMRFHGGLVLAAREDDKVIGMQYAFTGMRHGKIYLYSHMTGVERNHKYSGIGKELKMKQREWALQNGYDLIAWTYDPLMSLNANFNIHKIGAIARTYLENFYGEMEDSLNFGIPTDRFVAEWWIRKERESVMSPHITISVSTDPAVLEKEELPPSIGFRIPEDFVSMKRNDHDMALRTRNNSRICLKHLFSRGYVVVDFQRENSTYLLVRRDMCSNHYEENIFMDD